MTKWKWSFLWTRLGGKRRSDGSRQYHERRYVGPSLEAACDKMCQWLEDRPFPVAIDYEAALIDAPDGSPYSVSFPEIDALNHPIRKWVLRQILGSDGAVVAGVHGETQ